MVLNIRPASLGFILAGVVKDNRAEAVLDLQLPQEVICGGNLNRVIGIDAEASGEGINDEDLGAEVF